MAKPKTQPKGQASKAQVQRVLQAFAGQSFIGAARATRAKTAQPMPFVPPKQKRKR
jgi:hypothetical protein